VGFDSPSRHPVAGDRLALNVQTVDTTPDPSHPSPSSSPRGNRQESNAWCRLRRRVQLPGFRKGKVPAQLLEARYGTSFEQETIERAIERAWPQPSPSRAWPRWPGRDRGPEVRARRPAVVQGHRRIGPRSRPRDYKGLAVTAPQPAPSPRPRSNASEQLVEATAQWLEVDREAQAGDQLLVDYVRLDARADAQEHRRRDYEIRLGEGGLLPEFDQALTGAKAARAAP